MSSERDRVFSKFRGFGELKLDPASQDKLVVPMSVQYGHIHNTLRRFDNTLLHPASQDRLLDSMSLEWFDAGDKVYQYIETKLENFYGTKDFEPKNVLAFIGISPMQSETLYYLFEEGLRKAMDVRGYPKSPAKTLRDPNIIFWYQLGNEFTIARLSEKIPSFAYAFCKNKASNDDSYYKALRYHMGIVNSIILNSHTEEVRLKFNLMEDLPYIPPLPPQNLRRTLRG